MWNAHVAGSLLKMKHVYDKDKTRSITLKRYPKGDTIGCIFEELCLFFCFSAAGGVRKLMKPKHIFTSPEKPNYKNPCSFLFILAHAKVELSLTQFAVVYSEEFHFKMS